MGIHKCPSCRCGETEDEELIYGYLMNIMNAIKYVVTTEPSYREFIEDNKYVNWQLQVFGFILAQLKVRTGIQDLEIRTVWLGSGLAGLIYALPRRFYPKFITEGDKIKIQKLRDLFGGYDPSLFIAWDCDEPEDLKTFTPPPRIARLALNHVIEEFQNDGKAAMRKLLGEHEEDSSSASILLCSV